MASAKYNRTLHVPWSPGVTNDDKRADSVEGLIGVEIVITEKMDGANASLEAEGCFARTHSGPPSHPSFDRLKAIHAAVKDKIPEGMQIFGEWCFAQHSISYSALPGYFMLFNVRQIGTDQQKWHSWSDVERWAMVLNLPAVPVLFMGIVNSQCALKQLIEDYMEEPSACGGEREGIVVRVASSFDDEAFSKSVMKCVRTGHLQTTEDWRDKPVAKNKVK